MQQPANQRRRKARQRIKARSKIAALTSREAKKLAKNCARALVKDKPMAHERPLFRGLARHSASSAHHAKSMARAMHLVHMAVKGTAYAAAENPFLRKTPPPLDLMLKILDEMSLHVEREPMWGSLSELGRRIALEAWIEFDTPCIPDADTDADTEMVFDPAPEQAAQ